MKPGPILIAALLLIGCQEASSVAQNQVAAATPLAAGAPARSSRYTKVSEAACALVDQIEETGDFSRRCDGVDGWSLLWTSGDLRDDLTVQRGKVATALELPSLVANGAFDALGETVEWRGPAGGAPDLIVARVHVSGPEGTSDSGRLAIARLGDHPCLVAIVPPGPGQSARARAIADRPLPQCLGN